jgi:hypothetical protein
MNKVSRTPWTGDLSVARSLPTYRTTYTQNKRTQTSISRVGFILRTPMLLQTKTVHALDRAATMLKWSCSCDTYWSILFIINSNFLFLLFTVVASRHLIPGSTRPCVTGWGLSRGRIVPELAVGWVLNIIHRKTREGVLVFKNTNKKEVHNWV